MLGFTLTYKDYSHIQNPGAGVILGVLHLTTRWRVVLGKSDIDERVMSLRCVWRGKAKAFLTVTECSGDC